MADKITETNILGIGVRYISEVDPDTSIATYKTIYFKLNNPKSNLTAQEIKTVTEPLLEVQGGNTTPFWTDPRTNEAMSDASIYTAYTEHKQETEFDLETT